MRTTERDTVPRLALAQREGPGREVACAEARPLPTPAEIAAFGRLSVTQGLGPALETVEHLAQQGLAQESILLDLVGKTARWLGDQWLEDQISFTDVTTGLSTLQQVVHVLGPSFAQTPPHRGLVVLTTAPGEQHTLGLFLLGEFVRRAGWGVDVMPGLTTTELLSHVAHTNVDVLGFSVCREELLPNLARTIEQVRRDSKNRALDIMVGGRIDLTGFASAHGLTALENPSWAVRWLDERGSHPRPASRSSSP
ncbi:MAG: cobalamin-dependent protein [Myxococcaceae bacterium]|jgi:methanogenic corrinoid protein MtbC1|nr:cobalamin-dependent protein [Myxococcaceae bacterium]MCA3011000.1 cobalamin-dependent protein [Myxococcaceae bacterium]